MSTIAELGSFLVRETAAAKSSSEIPNRLRRWAMGRRQPAHPTKGYDNEGAGVSRAGQHLGKTSPMPTIEGPGDAVVRVDAVTICGTDLHILGGDVPEVTAGRILGHEAVGTVTAVGSGGAAAGRRRPRAGVVHHLLWRLPVLPRRQLRAVPGRGRLDPRPPDRRHAGRICASSVRRQLHPQVPAGSPTNR